MTRESMLLKKDFYDLNFLRGEALPDQAVPWGSACFAQEAESGEGKAQYEALSGFLWEIQGRVGQTLRISWLE